MLSFKGYLHRWLAQTTQLAPHTHDTIMPVLRNSTAGAVKSCAGGANGRQCGYRWTTGGCDGVLGAGQQMSVLAALSSLLVDQTYQVFPPPPVTNMTGGNSTGDPNAGGNGEILIPLTPITTGDRAGAGILTVVALATLLMASGLLSTDMFEGANIPTVKSFWGS